MAPHVEYSGVKARVRLPRRVQRKGSENISKRMLRLELVGGRLRRSARRKFMEVVKEDVKLVLEKEGDDLLWPTLTGASLKRRRV